MFFSLRKIYRVIYWGFLLRDFSYTLLESIVSIIEIRLLKQQRGFFGRCLAVPTLSYLSALFARESSL